VFDVREPYHIKDDVIKVIYKTAAILLDNTDSILDIAKVLYKYLDGRDDTCQRPTMPPKNPATI
jgi:hypothetical protein